MAREDLEKIYAAPGKTILAENWNMLVEAVKESLLSSGIVEQSLEDLSKEVTYYTERATRFDILWEGNVYAAGTNIPLSAPSANYDILLVQITLQGTQYRFMNFEDGGIKSFREINLADSASSTAINMYEVNAKKTNATTLQITSNKQQNLASGGTSWQTPTMDVVSQCITKIWGIKF